MSEQTVDVVKILKSVVCRVMICTKVMCCFPLDHILPLGKTSKINSRVSNLSEKKEPLNEVEPSNITSEVSQCRCEYLKLPVIKSFKENSTKMAKYDAELDTPLDSNVQIEMLKIKKVKKGAKRDTSKITDPQSVKRKPKEFLKNIFITKRIFSDTDVSRTGFLSKDGSSMQRSREYFLEMFDHFT